MRLNARLLEIGALLIILLLAAYLRLANQPNNPAWYTDEGTHLDIARNLIAGRVQYLAVNQSTLLFARLPVFEALLAAVMRISNDGIGALRALTGSLGVITVGVLYAVLRRYDRWLALIAALMSAIYPPAILYSRFGFSYNLLAPLVLIAFFSACEYARDRSRRWLAIAVLAIGLGAVSDLWMFAMIAPLMIVVLVRHWRDMLWSLPLTLLPFTIYAMVMLTTVPQAFLFDLRFVLLRLNQLPLATQFTTLAQNYTTLIAQDSWLVLAIVGLFTLPVPRVRWLSLWFFLLPIAELGRTTALFSLSFYYVIPLLPFVALGMASLIRYGGPFVFRMMQSHIGQGARRKVVVAVLIAVAIIVPFVSSLWITVEQVKGRFKTDIDPFLIEPGDARQAADYVNHHTLSNDVVIASPGLAWLLNANAADFQMSIAFTGQATPHLPADLPHDRWAFDPDYQRARFVVLDNLWRNWAVLNVGGVAEMLKQVESWRLVFTSGEVAVYENPR